MPVSPAPCPRVQRWPPKPVPRSLLMLRPNFHQSASAAFAAFTKDLEELRQEAAADAALAPWMPRPPRLPF
jgi:hypothetical protein